jgi:predicted amidohydrolase YtcJ
VRREHRDDQEHRAGGPAVHGGPVLTAGGTAARAGSVAVRGGRIAALGQAALDLAGPRTEHVSLRGRLLVPGFQDAHLHAVAGGLELGRCDLSGLAGQVACLDQIAAYARAHPGAEWITGGGWSLEWFPGGRPTAALLDQIAPGRPVYLLNRDHHGAWVNSRALQLAGITQATADPPDGRIERDAAGQPAGMLQEGAVNLVGALVPEPGDAELDAALIRAQKLLHSLGITAWQDALVGAGPGVPDTFETYRRAAAAGTLIARVRGALWWDRARGAEQIPGLLERRSAGRTGRFDPGSVKIMVDGIIENRTAALLSPYLDPCGHHADGAGLSFIDPELLRGYVTELDRLGFQVHFHALGDRAVREALDALDAARAANGLAGRRHHLAHLQVIHPGDIPRFEALGAGANIQPLWACHEPQMDQLTIPLLGADRAAWQYPFGTLHRAGATLAAGSDWPVSSPDPPAGIHVAVNRVAPDPAGQHASQPAPPLLPGERLSLATALTAYTAGSAWSNHLDHTGTIRVGNLADLAVLDRDPASGPPGQIADTSVLATYVEGERVW